MDDNLLKGSVFATPFMGVLYVFLQNPDREFTDSEVISNISTIKKSAVNNALRELAQKKLIQRIFKGRMAFNRLLESPLITHLKIISNLIQLQPLIDELRDSCSKIVLFGSRADGTHVSESDFDLFIVSSKIDSVNKMTQDSPLAEIVQIIARTPEKMLSFKKDEPTLNGEISKGTLLWERM